MLTTVAAPVPPWGGRDLYKINDNKTSILVAAPVPPWGGRDWKQDLISHSVTCRSQHLYLRGEVVTFPRYRTVPNSN